MFNKFYGFKKEPFNISPDPDFLYLSDSQNCELCLFIDYKFEIKTTFRNKPKVQG